MVADACPELALDWHPDNDKTPAQVSIGAKYLALWRCRTTITYKGRRRACRYEWRATVQNRARAGQGCPACAGKGVSDWNCLAANSARLTAQWGPDNTFTPYEVTTGSGYNAQWQCPDCPRRWCTTVDKRYNRAHDCPDCSKRGQATTANNLLLAAPPDLVRDWHPRNPKGPDQYRPNSSAFVWWLCHNTITLNGVGRPCGHEWRSRINPRFNGSGCPGCAGLAPTDWNHLCITDRHLIPSWHEDNALQPHEVTRGSHKKVLWRCLADDCGQTWTTAVENRVKGKGCPACAGLVVTERNNFAVRHPNYLPQWAETNRLTPYDITPGTNYRADWMCTNTVMLNGQPTQCAFTWTTRPSNRISGTDCPACMLWGTSRDEMYLEHELAHFLPVDSTRKTVKGASGKRWKVDIAIPDLRVIIEYDGSYWHRHTTERDTRKTHDLAAARWQVIRVREQPLDPITDNDVSAATGRYKDAAVATLTRIQEITGDRIDGLAEYASHDQLVNNERARSAADELRANVLANRLARTAEGRTAA
jgi:hypothetical protein